MQYELHPTHISTKPINHYQTILLNQIDVYSAVLFSGHR